MFKVRVYLERLTRQKGWSKADTVRAAINGHEPTPVRDRDFGIAAGFPRVDADPRPISRIPDDQLLVGFGS